VDLLQLSVGGWVTIGSETFPVWVGGDWWVVIYPVGGWDTIGLETFSVWVVGFHLIRTTSHFTNL